MFMLNAEEGMAARNAKKRKEGEQVPVGRCGCVQRGRRGQKWKTTDGHGWKKPSVVVLTEWLPNLGCFYLCAS